MKPFVLSILFIGFLLNTTAQVSKTITPDPGNRLYILSRQQPTFSGFKIQHSVANNSAGTSNPNRVLGNPITYIFTGNGNYNDPTNWFNNNPPPAILPTGSEID